MEVEVIQNTPNTTTEQTKASKENCSENDFMETDVDVVNNIKLDKSQIHEEVTGNIEFPENNSTNEEHDINKITEDRTNNKNMIEQDILSKLKKIIEKKLSVETMGIDNETQNTINIEKNYFKNKALIELARCSWGTTKQRYLKGCVWSPDGTCILSAVNEKGMHVMELPNDLYTANSISAERPVNLLSTAVHVTGNATIYDYCWYPFMNSYTPETCCWIASRQHEPIQMWDAFNGSLRGSYRGYDAVDEVEAALCITFSINGAQIIGGYKKSIKIFTTIIPGRDYTNIPIKFTTSCLAVNNQQENLLAIGSWNSNIYLHDMRNATVENINQLQNGHYCGVTSLKFTQDGDLLISGSRKENKLLVWDLKMLKSPLHILNRMVSTNQRIYFDISKSGKWLISGDTTGCVHLWDLKSPSSNTKLKGFKFMNVHKDCCNGVSLHPGLPIMATSSGQYHFKGMDNSSEIPLTKENSMTLWWHGQCNLENGV